MKTIPITETNTGRALDMRVSSKTGLDLRELIIESVAATQRFIMQPLPDELILTQMQFVSLEHDMTELDHTTDRLFVTPLNAMYVHIARDIDTIPEIEEVMENVEAIEAARDSSTIEAKQLN